MIRIHFFKESRVLSLTDVLMLYETPLAMDFWQFSGEVEVIGALCRGASLKLFC